MVDSDGFVHNSSPLVSIFMPTFNHASYIEEALQGALNQDYRPIEIIIPDDNSTDGTQHILARYAVDYPGIVVPILHPYKVGMNANFNAGIARCRGDFVAFTAGDDVFLSGKIQKQVEWFSASPTRVLCGHDVEVFRDETGEVIGLYSDWFPMHDGTGPSRIIQDGIVYPGTSIMVRRSAIPASGYDEQLRFLSDWKFFFDVLIDGGDYGYVPGILARYRRHARSVSSSWEARHADVEQLLHDRLHIARQVGIEHPELKGDLANWESGAHLEFVRSTLILGKRRGIASHLRSALAISLRNLPRVCALLLASALPSGTVSRLQAVKRKFDRRTRM